MLGLGLAARRWLYACNLVVTDIAGPAHPLHLLDARLLEAYPLVPLLDDQGLGIAFATYDGAYHAGLVADWEILPDLARVTDDLHEEFSALAGAAESPADRESPAGAAGIPAGA
jgi:hypothetical protein